MNSKPRQGGGGSHVSPANSPEPGPIIFARCSNIVRNTFVCTRREVLEILCIVSTIWEGKPLKPYSSQGLKVGRGSTVPKEAHTTTLVNCLPLVTICFTRESLVLRGRAHKNLWVLAPTLTASCHVSVVQQDEHRRIWANRPPHKPKFG